ncbi:MAG: acyl-CoA thioesterase [Bacteroidales bacterium]|nr:acyl-CoA thioesterase [Bacteroidales bacterium]
MVSDTIELRVRYCDVDRMGYLHHGNFAAYFEVGRTELLRKHGIAYKDVEDHGIILPVRNITIDFFTPAKYDDVISITTKLEKMEGVRLIFKYTVNNESGTKLCEGYTTLVFADAQTGKPIKVPGIFLDKLNQFLHPIV